MALFVTSTTCAFNKWEIFDKNKVAIIAGSDLYNTLNLATYTNDGGINI